MTQRSAATRPKLMVVLPAAMIGGAETRTFNLLKGLVHFDRVLLTQRAIADFYRELDIHILEFDSWHSHTPYDYLSLPNTFRYARAIAAAARLVRPDVILALMHNGTLYSAAARDLFRVKAPVIGSIVGNLTGYFQSEGREPTWRERQTLRYCVRRPNAVLTNAYGIRDDLIANFDGRSARIHVIHNGIDLPRCRGRATLAQAPLSKDRPWIVSACRLESQKDFATLLRAFRHALQHHPARLILVGEGERRGEILRIASELGIEEDVTLTGFQHNPFPWIAAADLFVLSSFYEGFPNVIVEALALGTPVVASNCPSGPSEIIQDGRSGYLVPIGDWNMMGSRCLEILTNATLRSSLAQGALDRSEQFGLDAMLSAFDRFLGQWATRTLLPRS